MAVLGLGAAPAAQADNERPLFKGSKPITKGCTYSVRVELKHAGEHGTATLTISYPGSATLQAVRITTKLKYGS